MEQQGSRLVALHMPLTVTGTVLPHPMLGVKRLRLMNAQVSCRHSATTRPGVPVCIACSTCVVQRVAAPHRLCDLHSAGCMFLLEYVLLAASKHLVADVHGL